MADKRAAKFDFEPVDIVPLEEAEQCALMEWAAYNAGKWPELRLLYHIPNEGKRSIRAGARLKAQGLKRGVPDNHLPVARGGYIGLYIELKRRDKRKSRVTQDQADWITDLSMQGHKCCVCWGWEQARDVLEEYMSAAPTMIHKQAEGATK